MKYSFLNVCSCPRWNDWEKSLYPILFFFLTGNAHHYAYVMCVKACTVIYIHIRFFHCNALHLHVFMVCITALFHFLHILLLGSFNFTAFYHVLPGGCDIRGQNCGFTTSWPLPLCSIIYYLFFSYSLHQLNK